MKDVYSIWHSLVDRTVGRGCPEIEIDPCPEISPTQTVFRTLNGRYKSAITWGFIGLVGIFSGLFILIVNPYDILFKWKSTFGDGGEVFEMWRTPPVDLYLRVFLWNVTNREAFMDGTDDKLKVQEVGPYVYRELMSHDNVTFNSNGTLSANPRHELVWVPELSEGRKEDDLVVMPNIALLSIADVVSDESYFTRLGLNVVIRQTKSQPLVEMTAREFMFGYKSTLMTLGNNFMPSWIYFDKLGLIDRMYDFTGDYETIYTGEDGDLSRVGLLDTYSGSTKIPQWDSPCGDVRDASDGTKFKGYIKENDTILFFRKSMCRAKSLRKVNETVKSGLRGWVFNFVPGQDDNGRVNESNTCFCKNKDQCLPNGLLDVHGCYYGFPIALSYPHYLDGDKILSSKVEGVNPDPEKHKSFVIVEPTSGLPIEVAIRYQINMALGNIQSIANAERFHNMILPLLWTESRMYALPDFLALKFKFYLSIVPIAEKGFMYFSFVVGVLSLCYCIKKFIDSRQKHKVFNSPWVEDDFVLNIERKLSTYIPEKRASMSSKELEHYITSLVAPLNQNISFQEFQEMKEADV